jgi:drug/metabolite transporter (DMT)-like permease
VLHVGWNLRSRQERASAAYFALSLLFSMLALSPGLWIGRSFLPALIDAAWPSLVGTAVFSTLYNASLAAAYRNADLSLVYPLARSLAPVWIALFGLVAGRGAQIGWGIGLGVPIIVLGCIVLPFETFARSELRRLADRRVLLPLATALATAGYTLCDDVGVRRAAEATGLGALQTAMLYACVHAVVASLSLLAWVVTTRKGRSELAWAWREQRISALGVGVASYVSYALVLAAMGLASDVSYVAAFRQVGIPLSVVAGVALLEERVGRMRAIGCMLATAGLVFVALG